MIKNLLVLATVIFFFAACNNDTENNDQPTDTSDVAKINKEIVEIALADFEKKAAEFVNKEVKVSGIVDHVCKKGGKKILLKSGDYSLHVFNDERYSEELNGSEISVIGIVEENKIDEASLDAEWEHAVETHAEKTDENKAHLDMLEDYIKTMKDSLKNSGLESFSEYSLKYVSHEAKK